MCKNDKNNIKITKVCQICVKPKERQNIQTYALKMFVFKFFMSQNKFILYFE